MKAGPKAAVEPSSAALPSAVGGCCPVRGVLPAVHSGAEGHWCVVAAAVAAVAGRARRSVLDADPKPRTAGWMMPRGQGKSTLVAALGLYDLLLGDEGAAVVVAATDERQAGIVFRTAVRMVELHPELDAAGCSRIKTELRVPRRGASFQCLPAEPKRLEGLDYTLAILDEIGVIGRDTYEVMNLAQGKRRASRR